MTSDFVNNSAGSSALEGLLTAEQIARLKEHWIETPEQFLSAVATEEGQAGMCRLLTLDESQMESCVKRLAEGLPPDVVERLQSTQPGGELGVILPKNESQDNPQSQGGGV